MESKENNGENVLFGERGKNEKDNAKRLRALPKHATEKKKWTV